MTATLHYVGGMVFLTANDVPVPDRVSVGGIEYKMPRVTFDDGGYCGCCGETVNDAMDFCPGCGARIGRKL